MRGGTHSPAPTQLLPAPGPVDDVEGLLGADDAERIDGGVGGGEVGVLAGTTPKSTLGALAPPQELADTAGRWGRGSASPVSPRWGDASPPGLMNPPRGRSRGCHPPVSVVTRKPPEEWAALTVAERQSTPLLWGQREVAPPESRGWPAVTVAMVGSPTALPTHSEATESGMGSSSSSRLCRIQ